MPAGTGDFPATVALGVSAVRHDAMESYHPTPEARPLTPPVRGMSAGMQTLLVAVQYQTHFLLSSASTIFTHSC